MTRSGAIVRDPESLDGARFDLAVIGGGVQGICVLLEAGRRGLSAVLLERGDFAGQTSWNSLKILHGGLRYLQGLDLGRSRRSVAAQHFWLDHFPELALPLPCLLPLYERGLKRRSTMFLGLRLYEALAATHPRLERGRLLSVEETLELAPRTRREGLSGAALWYDAYAPESERLLIETLRWAVACGGQAHNYVEARPRMDSSGAVAKGGRDVVRGVVATDLVTGKTFEVSSSRVINCTGPDLDLFAPSSSPDRPLFEPSLAFNLLLDRPAPSSHALALSARSRLEGARAEGEGREQTFFLVPFNDRLLAGTYHAPLNERGEEATVPDEFQIEDFLSILNQALPGLDASRDSILSIRSGLLPVERARTTDLSPHPCIEQSPEGLFHVRAVKLTTAPMVARSVLDRSHPDSRTASDIQPAEMQPPQIQQVPSARQALELSDQDLSAFLGRMIEDEAVVTLEDLLQRRTSFSTDGSCFDALERRCRSTVEALARDGRIPELG